MKRALLIGINYPGTAHALRGCVNDVTSMTSVLKTNFGFSDRDITLIVDNQATTANMKNALEKFVSKVAPGDTLYFHYSGHGSQVYDESNPDFEPDGLDEIIVPVDIDWDTKIIRDDELKTIFDKVPNGVNLTVVLDCCNSGGGIDQANQYQPLGVARGGKDDNSKGLGRYLPPPAHVTQIIIEKQRTRNISLKPRALQRNVDTTGLMISGCQAHQTSADAFIGGKYMGACTYYLQEVLRQTQYSVDYKTLVDMMNNKLATAGYTQRPELNGPTLLFSKKFLQSYISGGSVTQTRLKRERPKKTPWWRRILERVFPKSCCK